MGKKRTSYKVIAILLGLWLACMGAVPMKAQCTVTCSEARNPGHIDGGPVAATQGVPQHGCCCKGKAPAKGPDGDCAPNASDFIPSEMGLAGSPYSAIYDARCPLPSPSDVFQSAAACCDVSKGSRPDISGFGRRELIVSYEHVNFLALTWLAIEGPRSQSEGTRPNHLPNPISFPADRPLYLRNLSLLI